MVHTSTTPNGVWCKTNAFFLGKEGIRERPDGALRVGLCENPLFVESTRGLHIFRVELKEWHAYQAQCANTSSHSFSLLLLVMSFGAGL